MKFNQREWVTEMITGAGAGALTGVIGALLAEQAFDLSVAFGGLIGLAGGFFHHPLKWLAERRPQPDDGSGREKDGE